MQLNNSQEREYIQKRIYIVRIKALNNKVPYLQYMEVKELNSGELIKNKHLIILC